MGQGTHSTGLLAAPAAAKCGRPAQWELTSQSSRQESETAVDQQWEEARHSAWLRQLLSDDSSDEDEEERYGRFAESGRWMSELYGIPQYTTTTLGRECSAQ